MVRDRIESEQEGETMPAHDGSSSHRFVRETWDPRRAERHYGDMLAQAEAEQEKQDAQRLASVTSLDEEIARLQEEDRVMRA